MGFLLNLRNPRALCFCQNPFLPTAPVTRLQNFGSSLKSTGSDPPEKTDQTLHKEEPIPDPITENTSEPFSAKAPVTHLQSFGSSLKSTGSDPPEKNGSDPSQRRTDSGSDHRKHLRPLFCLQHRLLTCRLVDPVRYCPDRTLKTNLEPRPFKKHSDLDSSHLY